ncbi:MAG: hypothetical protein Q4A23_02295 [bacterium]|nr:hypothetical protein [bacterium]
MGHSKEILEKRSREKIISDIKLLVATRGYIFVLTEIISRDFFIDVHDAANVNWWERLHVNEVALLIGLMLKNKTVSFDNINKYQIKKTIKLTRSLLAELHGTYTYDFSKTMMKHTAEQIKTMNDEEKEFRKIFGSKEMIIETTFYGDMGFYDVQPFEVAQKLYTRDEDWIKSNTKFNIVKSKSIFFALKSMFNNMHFARSMLTDKQSKSLRAIDEMAFPFDLIVKTVQRLQTKVLQKKMFGCFLNYLVVHLATSWKPSTSLVMKIYLPTSRLLT